MYVYIVVRFYSFTKEEVPYWVASEKEGVL
jgi:hypothetical protein